MTDCIIIGGGASGLMTAICLKMRNPMLSVKLFEANDRVGKKLALTGNGRCNISNIGLDKSRYHGDSELAERLLNDFGYEAQTEFFRSLGIPFTELEEGKVYPMSLQAAPVVDALRFKAEESGVEILLGSPVTEVKRIDGGFEVESMGKAYRCRTLTVATGGKAGGKLGTESGYAFLKSLGHKIEPIFPSLVQIKTETELVRQLKGIKVMASVTAVSSVGNRTEYGEVLFCDYGLSGPPILQVSRVLNGHIPTVTLDILPMLSESQVKDEIVYRVNAFGYRPLSELLTGFINKRLGQVILKSAGIDVNDKCSSLSEHNISWLANTLKNLTFKVTGNTGFENAQVTAGGAQTAQFFDSMMSKKAKGLFAVGEVLDIDGDCGGFNLAYCWASGFAAAKGIKDYLEC